MTVVVDSPERNGSFLSFGENDHDIALFENPVAKSEETINHIALKFDGSVQELSEFRKGLIANGVDVQRAVDHGNFLRYLFHRSRQSLLENLR